MRRSRGEVQGYRLDGLERGCSKLGTPGLDEMTIRWAEKKRPQRLRVAVKLGGRIQLPRGLVLGPVRFDIVTDDSSECVESGLMKSAAEPRGSPAFRRAGLEPGSEFSKMAGSQDAWILSPALGRKWGSSGLESGGWGWESGFLGSVSWVQLGAPHVEEDGTKLERVRGRATKMIRGFANPT